MWRHDKTGRRTRILGVFGPAFLLLSGCSRPQRTPEQVTQRFDPPDLRRGPTPRGGPSAAINGGGAGGSSASGAQIGRVGGIDPAPVAPPFAPGRMAPNETSGSGVGDRGTPVSPDEPPVYPNLPVSPPPPGPRRL